MTEIENLPPESDTPARRPPFFSQLADVITAPADLFTELRPLPTSAATGFAVICLTVLLVVLSNFTLVFSKGAIEDVIRRQEKAMDAQVAAGKMSASDAATALDRMRGVSPAIFAAFGAAIGGIATLVVSGFWALMVFLFGKILGGPVSFAKAFEITGLAFVVHCLAAVAGSILILLRGSLALPNAALFVDEFDPSNKMHNLLQAIAPFSIWFIVVLAIGLACSGGISIRKSLIAFLGFWLVKGAIAIAVGYGQFA